MTVMLGSLIFYEHARDLNVKEKKKKRKCEQASARASELSERCTCIQGTYTMGCKGKETQRTHRRAGTSKIKKTVYVKARTGKRINSLSSWRECTGLYICTYFLHMTASCTCVYGYAICNGFDVLCVHVQRR